MKKTLLAIFALVSSVSVMADAPVFQWGKLIDSPKQQDMTSDVVVTADGNPVSFSHFGSVTAEDGIEFDGEKIAAGAVTNSASENRNLLIIKHNAATGERMWNIYSKEGYVDVASYGSLLATADGGLVALLKVRSSQVTPYVSPVIVDATGAEIEFPEWNTSVWIYNQVLLKIAADGHIEWARSVAMDQLPVPYASSGSSAEATTDGVNPYALAEDAEGNIYIGGNYRASMILTGDRNATYVLTPRNLGTYNGDVQQVAGGLYLIRLDSEGNYVNHIRAEGSLARDQICKIAINGDKLYFIGNVRGDNEDKLTLGGKTITMENSLDAFMLGCVSLDLKTVDYLTYYKSFAAKGGTSVSCKLRALDFHGSSLYILGGGQGGYAMAGENAARVTSQGKLEEGWMIAVDPADGSWKYAVNNDTNIGAYLGSFEYNGNIYVYGYRLNAQTGCFIDEYPAGSAERAGRYGLVLGGGAPTGYGMAFDPKTTRAYFCARGNNVFKFGSDAAETAKPESWCGILSCFIMDPSLSGVRGVYADGESGELKVASAEGRLIFTASRPEHIVVSGLNGINIIDTEIAEGVTVFPLPAGVYIAAGVKIAVL